MLTKRSRECVAVGQRTIEGIEARVTEVLGERGHQTLRRLLTDLLEPVRTEAARRGPPHPPLEVTADRECGEHDGQDGLRSLPGRDGRWRACVGRDLYW